MIAIREIDHPVLRVVDMKAMISFYTGTRGCSVERRHDDIGLVQLRAGRSMLDLVTVADKLSRPCGAAPGTGGRNLDHFCFRVVRFVKNTIRATPAGANVQVGENGSRYGAEREGPSIYIAAPEGNTIELNGLLWQG